MDRLRDLYTSGLAITIALSNAIGQSIILLPLGLILRPTLFFIPSLIYNGLQALLFIASVACWFSMGYPSLKELITRKLAKKEPKELAKKIYDDCKNEILIFSAYTDHIGQKELESKILLQLLQERLNQKYNLSQHQLKRSEVVHDNLMHSKRGFFAAIYRTSYNTPILRNFMLHTGLNKEMRNHTQVCSELIKLIEADTRDLKKHNNTQHADVKKVAGLLYDSILAKLPLQPTDSSDKSQPSQYIWNKTVAFLTKFYATFSNSVAMLMFGGLSVVASLAPMSPNLSLALLGIFAFSGYVSANGLEKPIVDQYVKLNTYLSRQSRELIAKMRNKAPKVSILNLDHTSRDMLGYLIGIGAGISYFMASTAFMEVLLGQVSILNQAAINNLIFNPLSASYASIIVGAISGFISFGVISTLILNSQLQLPKVSDLTYSGTSFKRKVQLFITSACGTLSALLMRMAYIGSIALSGFWSSLAWASLAGGLTTLATSVYDFCAEKKHSFVTNITFTLGLTINVIAAGIMSGVSGSIYSRLFGAMPGAMFGLTVTAANLEHTTPLLKTGTETFDNFVNTPPQTTAKSAPGV